MLGREVVEGQQGFTILDQAVRRLLILRVVLGEEALERRLGGRPAVGLIDCMKISLRLAQH